MHVRFGTYRQSKPRRLRLMLIIFCIACSKSQRLLSPLLFGRLPLSYMWWKQILYCHDRLVKRSADPHSQDRLLVQAFRSNIVLSTH